MSIKKIISGGQTGADQAALDVAIKYGIDHGGWISRGRKTENGPLPAKYNLTEMKSRRYKKRTRQNVIDSDGTIILSHGELTGGSQYTLKMAKKHKKPFIYFDLNETPAYQAISDIHLWIKKNQIETLNVAGKRASKDPKIYDVTQLIVTSVVFYEEDKAKLFLDKANKRDNYQDQVHKMEDNLRETVNHLISKLPSIDKATIARMDIEELDSLYLSLGPYIRNHFNIESENNDLLKSCRLITRINDLGAYDASTVILHHLWKKLRETQRMKLIKN